MSPTTPTKTLIVLRRYLNDTPALLSLLYDADLLPEQCAPGSQDWRRCWLIVAAWRANAGVSGSGVGDGASEGPGGRGEPIAEG